MKLLQVIIFRFCFGKLVEIPEKHFLKNANPLEFLVN